jgi:hypothetical protein
MRIVLLASLSLLLGRASTALAEVLS